MNYQIPFLSVMMKRLSSFILISLLALTAFSQAEDCLPEAPSSSALEKGVYVHDYTGDFSKGQELSLSNRFQKFRKQTSNVIVLLSVDSLCGMDVWDYAVKIGNNWDIGQNQFDNGLVIVYKAKTSSSRGQIAVATGRGLEGAVPDGAAKLVIDKEMIPEFKKGNINSGILKGVQVFEDLLREEYNFESYKSSSNKIDRAVYLPLIIFGIIILIWLIQVGIYARTNKISFWKALVIMSQTKGNHSGRWRRFNGGYGGFGGYRGGGGSSGGGGFGGFGGGSFGGGGASGSW